MSNEKPPKSPANDLMGELESIKELLEGAGLDDLNMDDDLDIDIPILDDIVSDSPSSTPNQNASLLNLDSIFEDDDFGNDSAIIDNGSLEDPKAELNLEDLDTHIAIPAFKLTTGGSNEPAFKTNTEEPDLANDYIDDNSPNDCLEEQQENTQAKPETRALPAQSPLTTDDDINIDFLIQEIVDEFIPLIEDKLRQSLSQSSPELIRQLAKQHLKP